jgi:hypothetical protein
MILGPTAEDFGERMEIAAARIGVDLRYDWKECGPPRRNKGVCVWLPSGQAPSRERFSLTTQTSQIGQPTVQTATLRWNHYWNRSSGEEQTFRDLCLSFVATVLPDGGEARELADKLLGNTLGHGELTVDKLQFYRNAYPDAMTCEAMPKFE